MQLPSRQEQIDQEFGRCDAASDINQYFVLAHMRQE
jgi:hypothetical protein